MILLLKNAIHFLRQIFSFYNKILPPMIEKYGIYSTYSVYVYVPGLAWPIV